MVKEGFCIGQILSMPNQIVCSSFKCSAYPIWCPLAMIGFEEVPGGCGKPFLERYSGPKVEVGFLLIL